MSAQTRTGLGKQTRRWIALASIALASIVATVALMQIRVFRVLNFKVLDSHFILRDQLGGPVPNKDIVLVLADKKALDTFPEVQMFWHPHYANAIKAAGLGGAKVMGLDLAFGVPVEKWEPDNDHLLAEAVS